ncbi:CPBP family intramembrane metalloprotease [Formosa sediminum]|uniref:CPBP family intramembrane metalloprotease n=1 Tax=Formosa sediminum TaxID=2594004 RepID=A0A516GNP4_9FLAO|nr:type II CAAX endopeptidase family protein [Formosa sediminum]QDO93146.1 CPBP family intramembrane metalloprotease [Formosa sediminum]
MIEESLKKGAWTRVLLLILPYFIVVGLFQILGLYLAGVEFMNPEYERNTIQHLIVKTFDLMGTFLVLWFFMKKLDKEPFVNLGFQIKNRQKDVFLGLAVGLIIMALGYIILVLLDEIFYVELNFNFKEVITTTLLFIVVSIVEETLLRGYVLRNLMYSLNNYVALILSSILFATMHLANPNIDAFAFFNLFLAGILLGLSYLYTKNLWFPIALHLSWNLFQSLFGFNVSGLDAYSLIEFKILDFNQLNGGAFGFEGSYLSILAQIITITCIYFYLEKHSKNKTQLT